MRGNNYVLLLLLLSILITSFFHGFVDGQEIRKDSMAESLRSNAMAAIEELEVEMDSIEQLRVHIDEIARQTKVRPDGQAPGRMSAVFGDSMNRVLLFQRELLGEMEASGRANLEELRAQLEELK